MWWIISVTAAIWALHEPNPLRNVACCLVIWWIQGSLAAFSMLGILLLIALIKMLHANVTETHSHRVPSTNVAPSNSHRPSTETPSPEALQYLHQLQLCISTYQSQATPKALQPPSSTSYYKKTVRAQTSQFEIEGDWDFHQAVLGQIGHRYQYDAQMSLAMFSATRSVFGVFKCYKCKNFYHDPRVWSSSVICVQIWISHAGQYRTRLYSQQCLRCHTYVMPEPDKDDYVTKVVQLYKKILSLQLSITAEFSLEEQYTVLSTMTTVFRTNEQKNLICGQTLFLISTTVSI
ncbi:hypothetical protein EMPS_00161 [Entomortierella parvispora]|uniref:3CxxC-type domain-containing protein n=1 Tax=Entomortierella parvispora TaxID=205924 RepID=A0A9P3GZL1_9FUNG|nr:hypothetical protein EMPS_00161 [Entomortierella parvispora]